MLAGIALSTYAMEPARIRLGTAGSVPSDAKPVQPLDRNELEALVARVALYPDEVLAIILPASTYPLQVVQAARYLEARKTDPSLEPSNQWDDTIIALLNYPEALALLNDDLDWTWTLGGAMINQQPEVVQAVERFRERAYTAGNLKSDEHKIVGRDNGAITITSADPQTVYLPYYEPAQVIYPQSSIAYHYYPNPYPLYYYPYPAGHSFYPRSFYGVSSAFTIGWFTNRLHLHHHRYRSHPYYGHDFRPSIFRRHSARRYSRHNQPARRHHRNHQGDDWHVGNRSRLRLRHHGYRTARQDIHANELDHHATDTVHHDQPRLARHRLNGAQHNVRTKHTSRHSNRLRSGHLAANLGAFANGTRHHATRAQHSRHASQPPKSKIVATAPARHRARKNSSLARQDSRRATIPAHRARQSNSPPRTVRAVRKRSGSNTNPSFKSWLQTRNGHHPSASRRSSTTRSHRTIKSHHSNRARSQKKRR